MEGVLTLLQREGSAGRDSLGRGEKRWKRGGCWEQPAGTSGQNPALRQLSPQRVSVYVCEGEMVIPSLVPALLLLKSETPVTCIQLLLIPNAVSRVWLSLGLGMWGAEEQCMPQVTEQKCPESLVVRFQAW